MAVFTAIAVWHWPSYIKWVIQLFTLGHAAPFFMFSHLSGKKQHVPSVQNKEPLGDTCITEVKICPCGQAQDSSSEIPVMTDEAYFCEIKF